MTKAMSSRSALGVLGSIYILIAIGCTAVAPAPGGYLTVAEREIFVELPGQTKLTDDNLKRLYRRGQRMIGQVRARCVAPHKVGTPCTNATTDVRITAVEGAKYINASTPPSKPQLIAWIENLGERPTFDGIQPMTEATYALVVDSKDTVGSKSPGNPAPIIRLVAFPSERRARSGQRSTAGFYGAAIVCHDYGQPYISAADYYVCDEYSKVTRTSSDGSKVQALLTSFANWVSRMESDDPTWFSCSSGCCTAAAVY